MSAVLRVDASACMQVTSSRCECLYASDSVFVFDDLPRVLVCKRLRLDASVCDYVFVFYDLPRVLVYASAL